MLRSPLTARNTFVATLFVLITCFVNAHGAPVRTADGKHEARAAAGATVELLDGKTGRRIARLYKPQDPELLKVSAIVWTPRITFSPDGRLLLTRRGSEDPHVWRVPEGTLVRTLTSTGPGTDDFSPDGSLILSRECRRKMVGFEHLTVRETGSGKPLWEFEAEKGTKVSGARFSPDGSRVEIDIEGRARKDGRVVDSRSGRTIR